MAADLLDEELEAAPIGDYFKLILLACAWTGHWTLQVFCNSIEDRGEAITEARTLELATVVKQPALAERALRATTWTVAARVITQTWPDDTRKVLRTARAAMPLEEAAFTRSPS